MCEAAKEIRTKLGTGKKWEWGSEEMGVAVLERTMKREW